MLNIHDYAILLDNLFPNEMSQGIINTIIQNGVRVTLFVLNKENIIANPLAIFDISEYFNWTGPTIITSYNTLEKTINYPVVGPKIIVGMFNYPGYTTIPNLDFKKINEITNEFYKNDRK